MSRSVSEASLERVDSTSSIQVSVKSQRKKESTFHEYDKANLIKTRRDFLSLMIMNTAHLTSLLSPSVDSKLFGNGSYFVIIIILIFFVGLPVLHMEMFLGEYTRKVSMQAWKMSPIMYGLFMYIHVIAFIQEVNLTDIGGRIVLYLYDGISYVDSQQYPWDKCKPGILENPVICYSKLDELPANCTAKPFLTFCPGRRLYQSAAVQYLFDTFEVNKDSGLLEIPMKQFACFSFYWLLILLLLLKKSFHPKLSFFTLVFTFSVMLLILIQVMIAYPGGSSLFEHFILIDSDASLIEYHTWYMALLSSLISMQITSPATFAYSSRVNFKFMPNFYAMFITCAFVVFKILVQLTSYSILATIAFDQNTSANSIMLDSEPTMFVTYPHFFRSKMPIGNVWTLVFFISCLLSLLTKQLVNFAGIIYSLRMSFKSLHGHRTLSVILLCLLGFLLTLIKLTRFGKNSDVKFTFHVIYPAVLIGFALETATVFWSYGVSRLCDDILFMCGSKPSRIWAILWNFIPAFALSFAVKSVFFTKTKMHIEEQVSRKALDITTASIFTIIVIGACIKIVKYAKTHELSRLFEPTFDWGPPNKALRKGRKRFFPDKYIPSQPLSTFSTDSTTWHNTREYIITRRRASLYERTDGMPEDVKKHVRQLYY